MAVACSNDDGVVAGGGNTQTPAKQRLLHSVKITEEGSDGERCLTIKYDDLNRIIEFSDIEYSDYGVDHCASYMTYNSDGTILHRSRYNGSDYYEYIVTTNIDGTLATVYDKDEDETYYYQYDSEKRLTSSFDDDDNYELFEWKDGNMVRNTSKWSYMEEDEKNVTYCHYNNMSIGNINIDVNWILYTCGEIYIMHPDDLLGTNSLFKQRNTNYLEYITDNWGTTTFDWTFDNQAYPTKCLITSKYDGEEILYTCTFEYLN